MYHSESVCTVLLQKLVGDSISGDMLFQSVAAKKQMFRTSDAFFDIHFLNQFSQLANFSSRARLNQGFGSGRPGTSLFSSRPAVFFTSLFACC
jgi:hypothetical protein